MEMHVSRKGHLMFSTHVRNTKHWEGIGTALIYSTVFLHLKTAFREGMMVNLQTRIPFIHIPYHRRGGGVEAT